VKKLNDIARARRQSLAQMAVAWTLRDKVVTSSLIGASKVAHVEEGRRGAQQHHVLGRRAVGHRVGAALSRREAT
jgi:L-glyceraldehyde 3-phosphate reductase